MCYYSLVVNFLLDSEVDDEIIDERPLENKSENDNNLVNHVTEQNAAVSFSDEDEQKVRYCRKKIGGKTSSGATVLPNYSTSGHEDTFTH